MKDFAGSPMMTQNMPQQQQMMNGPRFSGQPGGSGGGSDQRSVGSPHAHVPPNPGEHILRLTQ